MRRKVAIFMAILVAFSFLIIAGCGKTEKAPGTKEPVETAKPREIENHLGKGVVLAAHEAQDEWWSAAFHPAKIIKQPSTETKGEYQVEAVVGSGGVAEGDKYWSKHVVFKSHPAKKEELKPGVVVLWPGAGYGNMAEPAADKHLRCACWNRARIVKTDDLNKGLVEIEYEKPGLTGPVHIKNIRVCDDPKMESP